MNEKLYEELLGECERLTSILNQTEVGTKEFREAFEMKLNILKQMDMLNKTESETYIKDKEREANAEHNQKVLEHEKEKLQQQLKIEELRKASNLEQEKEKQKVTWQRVTFEMAKVLVPLGLSIIHYNCAAKKVFDFEEHGRITSTPGRELHLPKIFMK